MLRRNGSRNLVFASILLLGLVFTFSSSCRRNKDCDLVINVVDIAGAPLGNAEVHVYPKNGNLQIQDQTSVTGSDGVATFTFKLPAILQCDVTPDPSSGLGMTSNPVKLEEGKSVSKKIICQ